MGCFSGRGGHIGTGAVIGVVRGADEVPAERDLGKRLSVHRKLLTLCQTNSRMYCDSLILVDQTSALIEYAERESVSGFHMIACDIMDGNFMLPESLGLGRLG